MRFISAGDVQRAVLARPEYPYLRAEADEAYARLQAAQAVFMEAQHPINVLYEQEAVRLDEELNREEGG